ENGHQLREACDRNPRMRVARSQHLARRRIQDDIGAGGHRGGGSMRGRGQRRHREHDREQPPHLTLIFCPIVSELELTPGFNACRASTEVLNFAATMPNVSPDWMT